MDKSQVSLPSSQQFQWKFTKLVVHIRSNPNDGFVRKQFSGFLPDGNFNTSLNFNNRRRHQQNSKGTKDHMASELRFIYFLSSLVGIDISGNMLRGEVPAGHIPGNISSLQYLTLLKSVIQLFSGFVPKKQAYLRFPGAFAETQACVWSPLVEASRTQLLKLEFLVEYAKGLAPYKFSLLISQYVGIQVDDY
ncbi:hypothetical protein F8388_019576 [Cannabis sativa]|uniref:Uncharacterized protein n=1 Tax=Cannabis sativa TaxID=3483 RepID=A0A7J6FF74_CANSA|nr:hypothetical protein F8388_019576 [Cannabis sativa]